MSRLVPAGDTEFAKDAVFGYKASNIREVNVFSGFLLKKDGIVISHKKMLFSFTLTYLYSVCRN